MFTKLTKLNETETGAIRVALEEYIANHPKKYGQPSHWSQKIILEDMLDKLFWAS